MTDLISGRETAGGAEHHRLTAAASPIRMCWVLPKAGPVLSLDPKAKAALDNFYAREDAPVLSGYLQRLPVDGGTGFD